MNVHVHNCYVHACAHLRVLFNNDIVCVIFIEHPKTSHEVDYGECKLILKLIHVCTLCVYVCVCVCVRVLGALCIIHLPPQNADGGTITMSVDTKPTEVLVYHATTLQNHR